MPSPKKSTPENTTPAPLEPNALVTTDGGRVLLAGERGRTVLQPHVVAKIAGIAVREVPGVHGLVPFGAGQTLTNLARSLTGESRDLGVNVEVGKVEAAIDLRVVCDYGASIPEVAEAIRDSITNRIGTMTGLRVKEVNIEVMDLYFADEAASPQRRVA